MGWVSRVTEKTTRHKNINNYAKGMGPQVLKASYGTAKCVFIPQHQSMLGKPQSISTLKLCYPSGEREGLKEMFSV